jgi:DNA-binding transcriptional regulator YdaS (Cro superfamily)
VIDKKRLNRMVGKAIRSEYEKRDYTLETFAPLTGVPYSTLRKKIAGASPIFAAELITIAAAIGGEMTPEFLMDEAVKLYGGQARLMSDAADTTDELDTKRKQRDAAAMSGGTLDEMDQKAATLDDELDTPEPEAP